MQRFEGRMLRAWRMLGERRMLNGQKGEKAATGAPEEADTYIAIGFPEKSGSLIQKGNNIVHPPENHVRPSWRGTLESDKVY